MIVLHLSEEELQRIVSGQPVLDPATAPHLETCARCQEQVELYKLIVYSITQQPKPEFSFDLADTVLQQIKPIPVKRVFSLSTFIIAAFTVIPLYLFRKNISLITTGISKAFLLLSLATFFIVVGINIYKLYNTYHIRLKKLNISE